MITSVNCISLMLDDSPTSEAEDPAQTGQQADDDDAGDAARAYVASGLSLATLLLFGVAFAIRYSAGNWTTAAKTLAVLGYLPLGMALGLWIAIVSIGVGAAVGMFIWLGRFFGIFPPFWWRRMLGGLLSPENW